MRILAVPAAPAIVKATLPRDSRGRQLTEPKLGALSRAVRQVVVSFTPRAAAVFAHAARLQIGVAHRQGPLRAQRRRFQHAPAARLGAQAGRVAHAAQAHVAEGARVGISLGPAARHDGEMMPHGSGGLRSRVTKRPAKRFQILQYQNFRFLEGLPATPYLCEGSQLLRIEGVSEIDDTKILWKVTSMKFLSAYKEIY